MISLVKITKTKNLHALGMLLSLSAAGLGMLRDILLIYLLGFSRLNDILQIYLSLYFVISLLADPLRLSYLNLITIRPFKQLVGLFFSVIVIFMMFFIGLLLLIDPSLNQNYVLLAAFDGLLGIFASLFAFHKQRFGAYLSSQLVSVLPSFIMIPAVIGLAFLPQHMFVFCFLLMFMLIHTVQLFLLTFISIPNKDENKMPICFGDLLFLLRHCISTLGDQLFQIVGRLIFFQIGQGFVTFVSLFMKSFITFRSVFVDSYIGVKISSWNLDDSKDRFFELINNKLVNFVILLSSFFICFFDTLNFYLMGLQFLVVGAMSFYFSSLHRVVYYKFNRYIHSSMLITFTGLMDLFSALFVLFCYKYNIASHVMLIVYFWYILRLFVEISILRLYFNKFQQTLPIYQSISSV